MSGPTDELIALSLGLILRCLASNWVYRELQPDVYVNNRLSSLLDKGKTVEELVKSCVYHSFPSCAFLCISLPIQTREEIRQSSKLDGGLHMPTVGRFILRPFEIIVLIFSFDSSGRMIAPSCPLTFTKPSLTLCSHSLVLRITVRSKRRSV